MNNQIKNLLLIILAITILLSCKNEGKSKMKTEYVSEKTVGEIVKHLMDSLGENHRFRVERGVEQVAVLWNEDDGSIDDFRRFCHESFVADSATLELLFKRLEKNLETISGRMHQIDVTLKEPIQLTGYEKTQVDDLFAGYDVAAHLDEDFFVNKIAFVTILNFPFYSLEEKTTLGGAWTRQQWAYARMGDRFLSRIPSKVRQHSAKTLSDADNYISNYNIYMGHLLNEQGKKLFPENMRLITHWGLRDELKSNYADSVTGFEKQEQIYAVMQRIIDQSIPLQVINNNVYDWDPVTNKVFKQGVEVKASPEPNTRYKVFLDNFLAEKAVDEYSRHYPTAIARNFEQFMEIPLEDIKSLFHSLLSSPQVEQVASFIQKRLGRPLRPYDIWYDGFKARGTMSEMELTNIVSKKYPTPKALEDDLVNILMKLGWDKDKAAEIASLVQVDSSVGSGHAWGAVLKGDKARLRTRITANGIDYKGYNIAVHEFGHNVEQTITLNDVDYWMLNGVPNNAFTEAVAFIFQMRDLDLLGLTNQSSDKEAFLALDDFWSSYEIMGVALVDIAVWEWLYANPNATPEQLKQAVIAEAKKVWNKYYADYFGDKDAPILAVYSHMIDYPLYLSYYPIGHLISFQVERAMKGKNIADEMQRMYTQGRIVPQIWMKHAVGESISVTPLLLAVDLALDEVEER